MLWLLSILFHKGEDLSPQKRCLKESPFLVMRLAGANTALLDM